jgi:F-type H+-transporting ATPase subunit gamma
MMQRAATSILPTAGNMLAQAQQQRGMATLKMIQIRLKSVKNIQKITQSMKMVSAAKYTRAERELKAARPYGEGSKQFYDKAEVSVPAEESKKLYVAMTSDRGKISTFEKHLSSNNVSFCRIVRCCAHWRCSYHSCGLG